jgi:hypothetical protein
VREVAAKLKVSTATVYGLWQRGVLAHIRVVNAVRVRPSGLAALLSLTPVDTGRPR